MSRHLTDEHSTLNKRLVDVERRLDRLKAAYLAGVIELDQFGIDDATMKEEKAFLSEKLAVVDEQIPIRLGMR